MIRICRMRMGALAGITGGGADRLLQNPAAILRYTSSRPGD